MNKDLFIVLAWLGLAFPFLNAAVLIHRVNEGKEVCLEGVVVWFVVWSIGLFFLGCCNPWR